MRAARSEVAVTRFAPRLAHAVERARGEGGLDAVVELFVSHAASLRGIQRLTALEQLSLDRSEGLRHLSGLPSLTTLAVHHRGSSKPTVQLGPLATCANLRSLTLGNVRLSELDVLASLPLRQLSLYHCDGKPQRLRLPPTLERLELDGVANLTLVGVCPKLHHCDLWGTGLAPGAWLAQHHAIEEAWLNGCAIGWDDLLALRSPPRWIFMDDIDVEQPASRAAIARLEARGVRIAIGWPHGIGVWIPSSQEVSEGLEEPVYLSADWPRSKPA